MQSMTPDQIAALVADWRRRMFNRDGEIRRLIELDRHEQHDSDSYAAHCEGVAALAEDTLSALVSVPEGREGTRRPSTREQSDALRRARDLLSEDEPESDHVALMGAAEFDALDDVTARDVARHFLLAMGAVYGRKASMCGDAFATVTQGSHVPSIASEAPRRAGEGPQPQVPPAATGPTLAEAWAEYVDRQCATEGAWRNGVPETPRRARADLVAVIGADTRVATLTKEDARRYERFADQQPRRRRGKYNHHSTEELVEMVERGEIPQEDRRAARTVAKDTSAVWSFLRWCKVEHGTRIPEGFEFKTTGNSTPGDEDERYEAWSTQELQSIFDPATLGAEMRTRRANAIKRVGAGTPYRDGRQFADLPWVWLIALYTGARRGEIIGLTVEDVSPEHGETKDQTGVSVPVFHFVGNDDRKLKTKAAERCVPIHPDLIDIGILELAAKRRRAGGGRLLHTAPDIEKAGDFVGNRFQKYTEALGIHVPNIKVFHSLRHSFKTKAFGLMDSGQVDAIVGHRSKDSTGGTYIHATMVPQDKRWEMVKQLRYPLDVKGLRDMLRELAAEAGM